MQNHGFSVSFVTSRVSSPRDAYQVSSNEIAVRLKASGIDVYKAFRPASPQSLAKDSQPAQLTFCDYFTHEPSLLVDADVYLVMPNDMSLVSGLARILSLEERKERKSLIILTPTDYWSGLLKWFEEVALKEEMISPDVVHKISLVDTAEQIVRLILISRAQHQCLNE